MTKDSWRAPFLFFVLIWLLPAQSISAPLEPVTANPEDRETLQLNSSEAIDLVAKFILSDRVSEAAAILQQIKGRTGNPAQEQFLEAQIAIRQNQPETALTIYNAILSKDSSQVRIRIERARLLLAMGRDKEANAEFKALRQSALAAGARVYVDQFLATLRQRQPWSVQLRLANGFDSNASAGPDQDSVLLFGLPFQLSETAQKQGAFAARFSGAGSYRWILSERLDFRVFGGLRHAEYEGGDFDNTLLSGQAGSTFSGRSITSSFFMTGYRRWFGGNGLSTAWGGQGVFDLGVSDGLRLSALGSVRQVTYDRDKNRTGLVVNATLRAYKSIRRNAAVVGYGGYTHEDARVSPLKNETFRIGLTLIRQWSNQFRLSVTPEIARRTFKSVQPAFGQKRKDTRYAGAMELVAPPITTRRLVPFLTYAFTRNDSNIEFYQFNRHRINIGFMVTL